MNNQDKYELLVSHIKTLGRVVVAFSGGVDSTFLLKACHDALSDNVLGLTIQTPYIPEWEIMEARDLVKSMGVKHHIIEAPITESIHNNPENRCYLCKTFIFSTIKEFALNNNYTYVLDGSNFDDTKDYRPGLVALKELSIHSPLLELGWSKEEIRDMSKRLNLPTWDKPAYACLLTRLPYGTTLNVTDFRMIEAAELGLMKLGLKGIRVRKHNELARIEVAKKDRHLLFDEVFLDKISQMFKEIGFQYITLDIDGYRTGSFNEGLGNNSRLP